MNWIDIIPKMDFSKKPDLNAYSYTVEVESEGDLSIFLKALDLNVYAGWDSDVFASARLTKHWVVSWRCTDTQVGLSVYALDGIPHAVSYKRFRKEPETIEFLSKGCAEDMKKFILESIEYNEDNYEIIQLTEELPSMWFNRSDLNINIIKGFK